MSKRRTTTHQNKQQDKSTAIKNTNHTTAAENKADHKQVRQSSLKAAHTQQQQTDKDIRKPIKRTTQKQRHISKRWSAKQPR